VRNPVREYDEVNGPGVYKGGSWTKPVGPPVKMTLDQVDSIPLAFQLQDTVVFEAGPIRTRITPRLLTRADIFVLQMIKDSPERPLYFSRTAGSYGRELGLEPYLITQGLARKVLKYVPAMDSTVILVPQEGFVDVARTKALWQDVFQGPEAFGRKKGWPDKPSVGIPALYVSTGFMVYDILTTVGDTAGGAKALEQSKQIANATRISQWFDFSAFDPPPPAARDLAPVIPLDIAPKESAAKQK
jgi:hypothetical protein